MLAAIARYYSYIFHGLLALFLIGASGMALATGPSALHLEMLPWTGSALTYVVFFCSLFGLLTVALAALRKAPALFFIWALLVLVMMVKGYVFSGYAFAPGDLPTALELMAGALAALAGSWVQMRPAKI